METATIQNLLNTVSALSKKYDEINRLTGRNFNIFSIMRMETKEVKLHSAFIAELLSTDGSHNCGDVFAHLFIAEVSKRLGKMSVKLEQAKAAKKFLVKREEFIGPVNKDKTEGGSIDIVVFNEKQECLFIIENKINATDGGKQLLRYNNRYSGKPIFYLTKNGHEPKDKSITCNVSKKKLISDRDFFCISYRQVVLNWLVECYKEASHYPFLRETIAQYINVVKKITNQNIDKDMRKDVVNLITKDAENFQAATEICQEINNAKEKILKETTKQIKITFCDEDKSQLKGEYAKLSNLQFVQDTEQNFYLYESNWKYCISFEFGYMLPFIGIAVIDNNTSIENLHEIEKMLLNLNIGKVKKNTWAYVSDIIPDKIETWRNLIENKENVFLDIILKIYEGIKNMERGIIVSDTKR